MVCDAQNPRRRCNRSSRDWPIASAAGIGEILPKLILSVSTSAECVDMWFEGRRERLQRCVTTNSASAASYWHWESF